MAVQEIGCFPEILRRELENSEIPLAVYQFTGGCVRTVLVSDGLVRLHVPGSSREDVIRLLDTDMYRDVHPEDTVYVATRAAEFAKLEGGRYEVVYRQKLRGEDAYRIIHAVGYHRHLEDGSKCAVVVYDDVTDALDANGKSLQNFEGSVVEFLSTDKVDPFVIFDANTHEIYMVSASIERVWKPVKAFDSGIKLADYFFNEDELTLLPSINGILERGEAIIRSPRSGKYLILNVSQISWKGKSSIFLTVSEHADRYFDPLTGLANLKYARLCGENYIDEIREAGGAPVLAFIDIVGMKLYNSANGFRRGDELLVNLADCLREQFGNNLICRLANDHFAVIADIDGIEEKLAEIRKCVKGVVSKISMDLYVGICRIEELDEFLEASEKAKLACSLQKKQGDKFICYYDDGLHKDLLLQNYVVSHIDEAIANGYIKIYYQPVVRTITETFCGMEALARWIDPQYGFLNPGVFIGALEDSRQIHKLDSHVIELVCRELRDELEHGRPVVPVSFNLSRLDFTGCDIFKVVEGTLKRYGIGHELIRVEITESIMASDPYVQREIERFRLAGFEVWMDDFGSGYSSLNTLKDYKFDELKIDMAFLSNLNDVSRIIISSMVRMAKRLGLKTLAEGVETQEQMDFLKGIGCEKAQGYYYGKPQPLADTMKHMETRGIVVEDANMRAVYSKLGSLDYLVDTPKSIMSYEDGVFKFLFMNKQYEEQLRSLGFTSKKEVEDASNNPQNPVYYTLREGEKMAFMSPCEMTYATRGVYVFVRGTLIADINGCHIYDLMLRNTHVSAFDGLPNNENVTASARTKTVLLADSNPQNRAFLESVLRADYNMLIASDGAQAHELLLEHRRNISLVLLDAGLPKMDGFRLIQEFQGSRRDLQIPFVMMTDNLELAKESIRLGAYQFILKPITDKGMIKAKVAGAIRHAELQHQMALNYMEYVPGGVVLINVMTGKILYVNARALDIFECGSPEEFRDFVGANFRNAILPEDYEKIGNELKEQFEADDGSTKQISYRTRTGKGNVKRIYHVGRVYKDTPYGHVFSAFISEDDMAMKNYFTRKDAFAKFMESGEATHTKSYDKGYKGFLFWNLTKNSPVLRMDGISYIPRELAEEYTYELHYSYLSSLMLKSEENILKSMDYTRERLILDYLNKCIVPPLDISYDIDGYCFTMRSTFDMMMDPDSGDIVLKLVNECIKTTKE